MSKPSKFKIKSFLIFIFLLSVGNQFLVNDVYVRRQAICETFSSLSAAFYLLRQDVFNSILFYNQF